MQIRELSNKITSDTLNESLSKKFGYRINLEKFTESQLKQAQLQLSEKVSFFEKSNSFDSVLENSEYQKQRLMLDVLRQAIQERTLTPDEEKKREKYVKGMKKSQGNFKKKYGDDSKSVMYATATKMAKKESIDEAMAVLRGVLTERTLHEGEEEKASLIMSARDMVDDITGWLEDVAAMKAEKMLSLVDSIRDEMGSDVSQQFETTIKPALEDLYTSLETNRTVMAQAVSILTGEEGPGGPVAPAVMGGEISAPDMGELPETEPESGEELPALPAPSPEGRMKRESVELSRKLGTMLSSKKK